jgi:hypothetical protein
MKRVLVLTFLAVLVSAPVAEAQMCEESVTGSVCESEGAVCSPPNGGTCRQVTNNAGNPAGCVCSALAGGLYIVSEKPAPKSLAATTLPYLVGGLLGLILGVILFRKGARK